MYFHFIYFILLEILAGVTSLKEQFFYYSYFINSSLLND